MGISLLGEPGKKLLIVLNFRILTVVGTDIAIMTAAQKCLEMDGRPTKVQTGREMFPKNSDQRTS